MQTENQRNEPSKPRKNNRPRQPTISSQFKGTFKLGGGTLTIRRSHSISLDPRALTGTYALGPQTLDFSGTLAMDATISQMTTGFKSKLLKIVDPIFEKGRRGHRDPDQDHGVRSNPSFGFDKARLFKRRDEK